MNRTAIPEPLSISNAARASVHLHHRLPAAIFPSVFRAHIELGYSMIRTIAPKLFGGRLCRNCALTIPELPGEYVSSATSTLHFMLSAQVSSLPCVLVTLPHMTLILVPRISLLPR